MRCRLADQLFLVGPVNVNVARLAVDASPAIHTLLQTVQPQDPSEDQVCPLRLILERAHPLRRLARTKHPTQRFAVTNPGTNPMPTRWRFQRARLRTHPRSGRRHRPGTKPTRKIQHQDLAGHIDDRYRIIRCCAQRLRLVSPSRPVFLVYSHLQVRRSCIISIFRNF